MFEMSGKSQIMLNDERVVVRREAVDLGGDTLVVDGKRIKRGFRDFAIDCNIQPVTGDDLIQVPEGDRFNEQMYCYVADTEDPLAPNDLIFRPEDGWYQVQSCTGWGSYTQARMQRIELGPLRAGMGGPNPASIPVSADLLLR